MADRVRRRLAAIMAADVVGYSRLMELDEVGTLAALKARRRDILTPLVAKHDGRVVKVMGDGLLIEFASAVNAVQCAIDLQQGFADANVSLPEARRIVLRVGINLGDVIIEGTDLYGDGVNIAARLESLAEAGDICVSASVYDQVRRKLDAGFDDLGLKALKNIADPVHVYRLRPRPAAVALEPGSLPLPSKPSIAVLPFTNMSGEAEQDVFADGLTEDLITDLSRNAGLFVIARHSTFAYKGKSLDVRQIARDLGVRYVLEGSARRAAGRVRINVQLIDAVGGNHLWADRLDRSLDDVFAVQDEVAARIVEALVGQLTPLPARNRPQNMEAYDLCVRGRALLASLSGSPGAVREATILFQQAIALDPSYAEAFRWLAFGLWESWAHGIETANENRRLSLEAAKRAVAIDPNDAANHWMLGYLMAYEHRWAESDAAFAATFALDPNQADALVMSAELSMFAGRQLEARDLLDRAFRLNPQPAGWYFWELGLAQYAAGQYDAAVETLRKDATYRTGSRSTLAASLAQLDRMDEARREASLFMANNPNFTIGYWAATQPARDKATLQHFVEGYRKAGLPE
jgi:TolB-like protein/cytochrome c-type biogenesis protein CcmH/NrfG